LKCFHYSKQWHGQVTTKGFSKDYWLAVDTSDVGVGAVLLQGGKDDIDLPNCYLSLKFY
jgi:hypothetical protein